MKVWLDDCRKMPSDYDIHTKSARETIELLKTGKVSHISLDHDLGISMELGNGHQVADFIEEQAFYNKIPRVKWAVHSSNAPEVIRMTITLKNADRYWDKHEGLTSRISL
jgi:hypothetical protein